MMFQPEVAIRHMTSDGESITMAASVANVGYLLDGANRFFEPAGPFFG
jgi:hypothetical protein